eukprot:103386_1
MSECRRSKRHLKVQNIDSDYICPCQGKNAYGIAAECESCGYLSCKSCVYKRFDISSERKYKSIAQDFLCSFCTHNPQQPPLKKRKVQINEGETSSDNELNDEYDDEFDEFFSRMKVWEYSTSKMIEIQDKYENEIAQRQTKISKIKPTKPLTNNDYKPHIKKRKLWSHFMPVDILKMIFIQASFDKSVLSIILTCKNWRNIIIENENDEIFHKSLWYECVQSIESFEWKHLVLIPEKYLKIKMYVDRMQEMNMNEKVEYKTLVSEENDEIYDSESDFMLEYSHDTNIPLLIQIIYKCPDIYSIEFRGLICEDIFVVMGTKCKNLTHLRFVFCDDGHYDWFGYLIPHDCMVRDTLRTIHIERSDWINGTACLYFAGLENLAGITSENWYISGFGMYLLLDKCVNLEYFHICIDEYDSDEYWVEAFEALSRKNKSICSIEFIMSAIGFNDECLSYLMDDEACPKLENLRLDFHSCSKEMIAKFKKKRPDVKVQENPLEY